MVTVVNNYFAALFVCGSCNFCQNKRISNGIDEVAKYYTQVCSGLSSVPIDIPDDTIYIQLDGNFISNVIFWGLEQCKSVSLIHNQISELQSRSFVHLVSVEEIWLSHNRIRNIQRTALGGLMHLKKLALGDNMLTATSLSGSRPFGNLPSLQYLELHRNALTSLPLDIFYSPNINVPSSLMLSLHGNPILCNDGLCWILNHEESGQLFWIVQDRVTLSPTCSNVPGVAWEDLDLCNTFWGCAVTNLQTGRDYSRTCMHLNAIPQDIPSDTLIIEIKGNHISFVPQHAFPGLTQENKIKLPSNNIQEIDHQAFSGLKSLRELWLNQNKLKALHKDTFSGLESLNQIYLQNNALTSIESGTLGQTPSLHYVNLAYNDLLTHVPNNLFSSDKQSLSPWELTMSLTGNPIICSGDICWMKNEETFRVNWLTKPECDGSHDAWNNMDCSSAGDDDKATVH